LTAGDLGDVVRSLGLVQTFDALSKIRRIAEFGVVVLGVVGDAFLAAGNRQQLAVERLVPYPRQACFGEGLVESRPMTIAFSFSEGAIDIEN
jgi:hypothetical protein